MLKPQDKTQVICHMVITMAVANHDTILNSRSEMIDSSPGLPPWVDLELLLSLSNSETKIKESGILKPFHDSRALLKTIEQPLQVFRSAG